MVFEIIFEISISCISKAENNIGDEHGIISNHLRNSSRRKK
jgi:hypothetical protein